MSPFELKPNCLSTQSDPRDGGNAVRNQLPDFGAICACNKGFTHVTETEQVGHAKEDDSGFAYVELRAFSNASSKKAVYIQLK
jgi:hypothetical protein